MVKYINGEWRSGSALGWGSSSPSPILGSPTKKMETRFRNRYLIASTRLQNYDYSSNGYYFITICTKNREHYFGEITNDKIQLSKIGKIVQKYWLEIPKHFPFVKLNEFVVMPNHVHGILIIEYSVETPKLGVSTTSTNLGVSTTLKTKITIGVIINQYKRACTMYAKINKINFTWQPRFYDHIIRNEKSFYAIREYIKNNPKNWNDDRNNIKLNNET